MEPTITILTSGLNLLSFQGITTFRDAVIVATVEGDLVRVAADGSLNRWTNVSHYGIPTGLVGLKNAIAVALSAQESGHFLIEVKGDGQMSTLADLSELSGEFGAPLAVAGHEAHYPYYLVAISTDVVGSAGLIARVTQSGKTSVLTTLAHSPLGIGIGEGYAIATQEDGSIIRIALMGATQVIAQLEQTQWGRPIALTRLGEEWIATTMTGWLVALQPDGTLSPIVNLLDRGFGKPTTLTPWQHQLVVATQQGTLLLVER
jgi:hypothetical protein